MVSDRELQVWQNKDALIIQSRYCDDPKFTLEQEKALHEIARSFLIVNRKRASDKRRKERRKGTGGRVMSDLKPCPFCGGKAALEDYSLNGKFKIVKCAECGARTKAFFKGLTLGEDAIEAWNKRVGEN